MSVTTLTSPALDALEQLRSALDALDAVAPDTLSWAEQEALVRGLDEAKHRLDGVRLPVLEAFERGRRWEDEQHISAAAWVRAELRRVSARGGCDVEDSSCRRPHREWRITTSRA